MDENTMDLSLLQPSHVGLVKSFASLALGFLFCDRKQMVVPCHLFFLFALFQWE